MPPSAYLKPAERSEVAFLVTLAHCSQQHNAERSQPLPCACVLRGLDHQPSSAVHLEWRCLPEMNLRIQKAKKKEGEGGEEVGRGREKGEGR